LNIPGEDKANVISAREFVGWYNGLPDHDHFNPDLSGDTAILLGQGNVAVDVARVLLAPIDELKKTDITENALEALSRSKINKAYFAGRRGPLQAAFTIAELREMLKMTNIDTIWRAEDFSGVSEQIEQLPRPRKRMTELMMKSLEESKTSEGKRNFLPIFFRSPVEIKGTSKVESVNFNVTKLVDNRALPTDDFECIEADLVCRSIGYRSISVDDSINFDAKRGHINNIGGRVPLKNSSQPDPGLYVAGWLGTGPSGKKIAMRSEFQ
jgi:adrenodoxin-NADP+ reductase